MTRQQFGFVIGFLVAFVWAVSGFGVAAAVTLAGIAGWTTVRLIDGEISLPGLVDRTAAAARRR
jgi:hypothetical protein